MTVTVEVEIEEVLRLAQSIVDAGGQTPPAIPAETDHDQKLLLAIALFEVLGEARDMADENDRMRVQRAQLRKMIDDAATNGRTTLEAGGQKVEFKLGFWSCTWCHENGVASDEIHTEARAHDRQCKAHPAAATLAFVREAKSITLDFSTALTDDERRNLAATVDRMIGGSETAEPGDTVDAWLVRLRDHHQ